MIKTAIVTILIFVLVIIGPILTIWSMNVLFPALAIPYTIETWLATIILAATIRANVTTKGDK